MEDHASLPVKCCRADPLDYMGRAGQGARGHQLADPGAELGLGHEITRDARRLDGRGIGDSQRVMTIHGTVSLKVRRATTRLFAEGLRGRLPGSTRFTASRYCRRVEASLRAGIVNTSSNSSGS